MITLTDISGEGSFQLPAGSYAESVVIREKSGNDVIGGIRFGTAPGESDIVGALSVGAGAVNRVTVGPLVIDFSAPKTIYFDAVSDWNGAAVDIFINTVDLGA
jgi:hypothetical protein